MYRTCIFCSADLGSNESIEEFPVGRGLAFDAWRGRLWAVCPKCTRWNLAPIEERWEAVESAEKLFRDSRLRVHSENVGLCKLPDGTRLIRIGEAIPREIAAWRYGDQLVRRRKQALLWGGVGTAAAATVFAGGVAIAGAAAAWPIFHLVVNGGSVLPAIWAARNQARPLYRVHAEQSPDGRPLKVTVGMMQCASLIPDPESDGVAVKIPTLLPLERVESGGRVRWQQSAPLLVTGSDADRLLSRTMARANARGTNARRLDNALARLASTDNREAFMRQLGERDIGLWPGGALLSSSNNKPLRKPDIAGAWRQFRGTFRGELVAGNAPPILSRRITAEDALALEMALHEESERRALEGELAALEAAWREAEEIAAIADVLPDDPLDELRTQEVER